MSDIDESVNMLEDLIIGSVHALHESQKNSLMETIKIMQEMHKLKDEEYMKLSGKEQEISLLPLISTSFMNIDEAEFDLKIDVQDVRRSKEDKKYKMIGKLSESANMHVKFTVKRTEINIYKESGSNDK